VRLPSCLIYACLISLSIFTTEAKLHAQDWPQFRGPDSAGTSTDQKVPTEWSAEKNLVWKMKLPAAGASSPIVLGKRIYLTGFSGYGEHAAEGSTPANLKLHVMCYSIADGDKLWDQSFDAAAGEKEYRGFVALHGYASGTPATDGEAIYANFGKSGVVAYDLEGNQLWKASLGDGTHGFGSGTSPVLYKDLVIINAFVESGKLYALDKKTGKQVWEADGLKHPWNTPLVVSAGDHDELVLSNEKSITAYDPTTGKELWTCEGIDDYVCPSVIAYEETIFAIGGRQNTAIAVKAGGSGDVTGTNRIWKVTEGSNVSSPVYHDGHLYFANEGRGIVYCLNAKTGEVVFKERLKPSPGRIYASPTLVDGKLIFVSRDKGTYVVAAKPQFELLAHNVLEGDNSIFNASPAVTDGKLIIRSNDYLYCIGE
jgi:outer membrane protein assembly factor BamB